MTKEEAIAMLKSKMDGSVDASYEWAETVRMAIEALSAEPNCKDCKKRNNTTFFMNDEEAFDMAIESPSAEAVHKPDYSYEADMARRMKEALSAETVQRWIPCSERLPNESGWYVATICRYERIVDVIPYNSGWNGVITEQEVIAWMPLPKPYREDGEA